MFIKKEGNNMEYSVNGVKVIDKYRHEKGINGFDRSIFPKMEFSKCPYKPIMILVIAFDVLLFLNVIIKMYCDKSFSFDSNDVLGLFIIQMCLVFFIVALKSPEYVPEEYYSLKEKKLISLWISDIRTMNIVPWYFNNNERMFVKSYCDYLAYASDDVASCGLTKERREEIEAFLYYKWENLNDYQRKNIQRNGIKFRFYALDNRQFNTLMSIKSKSKVIKKDYKESNIALQMMYDHETENHLEHKYFI